MSTRFSSTRRGLAPHQRATDGCAVDAGILRACAGRALTPGMPAEAALRQRASVRVRGGCCVSYAHGEQPSAECKRHWHRSAPGVADLEDHIHQRQLLAQEALRARDMARIPLHQPPLARNRMRV